MQSATLAIPASKISLRTGSVLSGIAALFLLMDSTVHLLKPPVVLETFAQMGCPASMAVPLGVLELVCLALYLYRRTSVLGAILLTGYLGGAVALHMRIGSPLFSHLLFPVYAGALVWGGLYLRDERVRALAARRGLGPVRR
ncbi:MAG: DoxX family protein, partial [Actinomycetota bacterium]